MKQLFSLILATAIVFTVQTAANAGEITRKLRAFERIIASPKVNVILRKGDKEEIRLVYKNVTPDKINIEVRSRTLRIFLDGARITEKKERALWYDKHSEYEGVVVTAYITYRDISHLEIRGNQELTCHDPIKTEEFILKAYGENEITLSSVKADYLKASIYGENTVKINGGKAMFQKYRLFGDNNVDVEPLSSYSTITNIYGESKISLSTQDELKINSFGEGEVSYNGDAAVTKGLIFGSTQIRKLN